MVYGIANFDIQQNASRDPPIPHVDGSKARNRHCPIMSQVIREAGEAEGSIVEYVAANGNVRGAFGTKVSHGYVASISDCEHLRERVAGIKHPAFLNGKPWVAF